MNITNYNYKRQYLAIISDGKIKAEGPKPSNKGLAWTHRMMEEVYDSRYEREQVSRGKQEEKSIKVSI